MISLNESRGAQCDVRLTLKTQDQTLIRQAMDGAGLTRWEAEVLPRVVEDIYFQGGTNRPWKDGQVRYQCVDITAGPGRKLSECPLVPTALSVIDVEKDREVLREHGLAIRHWLEGKEPVAVARAINHSLDNGQVLDAGQPVEAEEFVKATQQTQLRRLQAETQAGEIAQPGCTRWRQRRAGDRQPLGSGASARLQGLGQPTHLPLRGPPTRDEAIGN
jgi:hypothetical protein